jgi:tetratricopeptide (TPR) repeat protein
MFGYFEGGLLADFLVEERGEGVLREMLERFARDQETPEVIQGVLGVSCEELDRKFLEWLDRTRISKMKVQPTYTEEGRRRLLERVRAQPSGAPPDAELLAQVAWAYHRTGRPVDRDDFLDRALKADPRLPSARFLLAERALLGRGREDERRRKEAREHLEAGIEAGGEEFFAFIRLAELLAREGNVLQRPGAGERPRPGADPHEHGEEGPLDEGKRPPLDEGQRALRERLLDLLERAKRCFPRYVAESNPYITRARLLRELGRDEEAYAEVRAFCEIDDSDVGARTLLAKHALERSEWSEAKRWLLELQKIDPFVRRVWRDLARCEKELHAPASAITLLERALVIDPSTEPDYDPARAAQPVDETEARTRAELLLDLAELRLDVGETDAALRALDEARGLDPGSDRLEALTKRAKGDA